MARLARDERRVDRQEGPSRSETAREDFVAFVRDALSHLYDPAYLQTHPLTRYLQSDSGTRKPVLGRGLRQALLEAIEALHPGAEGSSDLARHSRILQLRYVEGLDAQEAQSKLAISRSHYYREQQTALEAVASVLAARWGVGGEGGPDDGLRDRPATPTSPEREPSPRHNLPLQLTSFVGRERETVEVKRLLGNTRLLTLTGTGGAGKTRLALQVAGQLAERSADYPDGVWLVELAALSDPALVPQTVASALGVSEQSGLPVLQTLVSTLKTWHALIVLDNCEHLLDACASLADSLLRHCPSLRLLVTSREALRIAGETTWRVPSLDLPDLPDTSHALDSQALLASLEASDAVRLFVERALAVLPSFDLTAENALAVAQLCRRLDGIPLALELAATRARALGVEQIVSRLDQRFLLLASGSRVALPRQQTLRATIDWGYGLLSAAEQALFRALAVFSGAFSLEAAEEVGAEPSEPEGEVLDLLLRLVDKSLVLAEVEAGATRYRLLETIRQYGWEKLQESGGAEGVERRHAEHYLRLAEEAAPELIGPHRQEWLDRLEVEHDNFRRALGWCLENDVETGLRAGAALWWFWHLSGRFEEGRRWLEALLAKAPDHADPRARAQVLLGAGLLAQTQNDFPPARSRFEESLAAFRELGDRAGVAQAMGLLGRVIHAQTYFDLAKPLLEESLAIFREVGDLPGKSLVLASLAYVSYAYDASLERSREYFEEGLSSALKLGDWMSAEWLYLGLGGNLDNAGDPNRARQTWSEGLAMTREHGDRRMISWLLGDLGNLEACEGNYRKARPLLEESLQVARDLGDTFSLGWRLLHYGNLLRLVGEADQAKAVFEENLAVSRDFGDRQVFGLTLASLGNLALAKGELERAHDWLDESLRALSQTGASSFIGFGLRLAGILALRQGDHGKGTRLVAVGTAQKITASLHYSADRAECDAALAEARAALGEEAFAKAWAEGQAMSLEKAVEYALRGDD